MKSMMKELVDEVPTSFKVTWAGAAVASLTFTGFVCWCLFKLVTYVTG